MSTSKSCALPSRAAERPRSRKPHFFSTGFSGGNFSWSFVMRSTLMSANRSSTSSSSTHSRCSVDSSNLSPVSGSSSSSSSGVSSDATSYSSGSSSRPKAKRSLWALARLKGNKREKFLDDKSSGVQLDRSTGTDSGEYLTVYVGVRREQIVKYVINRSLLTHSLFQVMLKVSEDEFENEHAMEGVPIICDPDLFLEVVRAIDGNLESIRIVDPEAEEAISGLDV